MRELPAALAARPTHDRPRVPRPWVNEVIGADGSVAADFRQINQARARACGRHGLCGLCGGQLGGELVLLGSELAAVLGVFADPPMHEACAEAALWLCPHLRVQRHGDDGAKPTSWVLAVASNAAMRVVGSAAFFTPGPLLRCRYFRYRDGVLAEDPALTGSQP